MNGPFCKKDEQYISPELWNLWKELFGEIGVYHISSFAIYFIVSDKDYYNRGGQPTPKNDDIICIIGYTEQGATYSVKDKDYYTIKEYISALKNMVFL